MSLTIEETISVVSDGTQSDISEYMLRIDHLIQGLIAALLILILLPLMVMAAMAIYLQDGGGVVFAHRRIGRGAKGFNCLKFRTMAIDAQQRLAELLAADPAARAEWARDHKLKNDPRISPVGHFLRKTSLDELPQLFNVVRGEMSLIGPRPIVDSEVPRYGRRFKHYCKVRPGMTGLWQVYGRNNVTYRRRVALDAVYSNRKGLLLDVHILARTVPVVLLRRGSY